MTIDVNTFQGQNGFRVVDDGDGVLDPGDTITNRDGQAVAWDAPELASARDRFEHASADIERLGRRVASPNADGLEPVYRRALALGNDRDLSPRLRSMALAAAAGARGRQASSLGIFDSRKSEWGREGIRLIHRAANQDPGNATAQYSLAVTLYQMTQGMWGDQKEGMFRAATGSSLTEGMRVLARRIERDHGGDVSCQIALAALADRLVQRDGENADAWRATAGRARARVAELTRQDPTAAAAARDMWQRNSR